MEEIAHPSRILSHGVDTAWNAGSRPCLATWCPGNMPRLLVQPTLSPQPWADFEIYPGAAKLSPLVFVSLEA